MTTCSEKQYGTITAHVKNPNWICVAFSRARCGLFIFGQIIKFAMNEKSLLARMMMGFDAKRNINIDDKKHFNAHLAASAKPVGITSTAFRSKSLNPTSTFFSTISLLQENSSTTLRKLMQGTCSGGQDPEFQIPRTFFIQYQFQPLLGLKKNPALYMGSIPRFLLQISQSTAAGSSCLLPLSRNTVYTINKTRHGIYSFCSSNHLLCRKMPTS